MNMEIIKIQNEKFQVKSCTNCNKNDELTKEWFVEMNENGEVDQTKTLLSCCIGQKFLFGSYYKKENKCKQ